MLKQGFLILFSISFITYIYFGLHIILLAPRQKLNQIFLCFCMSFTLWSMANIFLSLPIPSHQTIIWEKAAFTGATTYYVFILRFFLTLTGFEKRIRHRLLVYILIWLLPALMLFFFFTKEIIPINFLDGLWSLTPQLNVNLMYNITSIILIILWAIRSELRREKIQAFIIIGSILIVTVIDVILPFFISGLDIPSPTCIIVLSWLFGIWIIMSKYRFLDVSLKMVAKDIAANIDESIILLNSSLQILWINTKTETLIEKNIDTLTEKDFSFIISQHKQLCSEIQTLMRKKGGDFSCRIDYKKNNNKTVLMDTRFSLIKDRFQDVLGVLILGREVRELKQLKAIYRLTGRETNTIQCIINGLNNKEIAEFLGIAERTVKAHITNIYQKLGVINKVQLFSLLKDFNINPTYKASKVVLV